MPTPGPEAHPGLTASGGERPSPWSVVVVAAALTSHVSARAEDLPSTLLVGSPRDRPLLFLKPFGGHRYFNSRKIGTDEVARVLRSSPPRCFVQSTEHKNREQQLPTGHASWPMAGTLPGGVFCPPLLDSGSRTGQNGR